MEQARHPIPASLKLVRDRDGLDLHPLTGDSRSDRPRTSPLQDVCRSLAIDLAAAIDALSHDLHELRGLATRLPAETPRMVASSWEQTGRFLHEQSLRQETLLSGLQQQAAADLLLATELVGRLQQNQDELRRIGHQINAPFEDAAVRLFRAAPGNADPNPQLADS